MKIQDAVAAALALAAMTAQLAEAPGPVEAHSWDRLNVFTLKMTGPGPLDEVTWRGAASLTSGDIRIDVEQSTDGKKQKGTMMVVAGRVLAVRGLELPEGAEIDSLDAAALSLRMVTASLARALPAGPDAVKERTKVDYLETNSALQAGTQSAGASIPPPWSLKGFVEPQRAGAINFELDLTAGTPIKPETYYIIRYSGSLATSPSAPGIVDSTSLRGWTVYSLGPRSRKQGSSTIMDYGASKNARSPRTVGQLRAASKEEDKPAGKPDATRDFTGFWKERCEQNFGVRIQRSAPGAPYSISFCGPGGCDESGNGRMTYINGDRRFQVVGTDEIKERLGDEWTTYRRCSREPPKKGGNKK